MAKISRRGLFGLLAGAAAAPLLKVAAEPEYAQGFIWNAKDGTLLRMEGGVITRISLAAPRALDFYDEHILGAP